MTQKIFVAHVIHKSYQEDISEILGAVVTWQDRFFIPQSRKSHVPNRDTFSKLPDNVSRQNVPPGS